MLIAQITDLHIGFEQGKADEYNLTRLERVVECLTDGPNRPDLLMMTGDLTEFGDAESYSRLADAVGRCPFPVWAMAGNHDLRAPLLEAFPATPVNDGFVQYALELEGFRLIALDTVEEGRHGGAFCKARAEWLSRELSAHPEVPTVIAMHHPPFETGLAWVDCDRREPWIARFAEAIAGHGQVRAIVSGHLHRNIQTLWNGFAVSVCASTAPLLALDLNPVNPDRPDGRAMVSAALPAYALHRWDGRGLITHYDAVGDFPVMARYDKGMQEVVRMINSERRGR